MKSVNVRPINANSYRKKLEKLKKMEHFNGITALNLAIAALDEEPTIIEKEKPSSDAWKLFIK